MHVGLGPATLAKTLLVSLPSDAVGDDEVAVDSKMAMLEFNSEYPTPWGQDAMDVHKRSAARCRGCRQCIVVPSSCPRRALVAASSLHRRPLVPSSLHRRPLVPSSLHRRALVPSSLRCSQTHWCKVQRNASGQGHPGGRAYAAIRVIQGMRTNWRLCCPLDECRCGCLIQLLDMQTSRPCSGRPIGRWWACML